uniref:Cytokine receptor-like factor 2 n=1 Tax=Catagonus wagneri TaxID=51154 RepID=A0A8C3VXJ7_9CETA
MGDGWSPLFVSLYPGALQLQIINFNFETVQVTWNTSEASGANLTFFYKDKEDYRECSSYTLRRGYTTGCLLEVEKDELLYFSIRHGTHSLLNKRQWISSYLKPRSPTGLSFQWRQGAVTVTCSNLRYKGLLYEIQHKGPSDAEWQSNEAKTCNVTISGLDGEKCYFFRARVKTRESSYGPDTHPSDWSEVTHRQRGELRGNACLAASPCSPGHRLFPNFLLITGMVIFLTASLLVLSFWKLQRIKKVLMPSVPDPRSTFSGLFESHQGNFQEWIKDTQNVTHLNKTEEREQACVLEEAVVQLAEAERPKTMASGPADPQTGEEEAARDPCHLPCQPPQVASLQGFTFVMSDNSYMML